MTNQELIDRYLHAIGFLLPRRQKSDIVAELAEDLSMKIAERESALSRPLAGEELEALLRERGNPLFVASAFRPQRHLIGPLLYPLYAFSLKFVALAYLLPGIAVGLGLALFSPAYRALHPGGEMFWALLAWLCRNAVNLFAFVTLLFAALERSGVVANWGRNWNLRAWPTPRDRLKIERGTSLGQLVGGSLFASWWIGWLRLPQIVLRVGGTRQAWTGGSLWQGFHEDFFWPVLALILAEAALGAANLLRPRWSRLRLGALAAIDGALTVSLALALRGHWGMVRGVQAISSHRPGEPLEAMRLDHHSNLFCFWIIAGAAVFYLGRVLWAGWRLLRLDTRRQQRTAMLGLLLLALVGAGGLRGQTASAQPLPKPVVLDDDAIRDILKKRVDGHRCGSGMVVGVITPQGQHVIGYGKPGLQDDRPLDGDTVFEVGSVTKVFTALLLSDMVQRGEVALGDPVRKHLPPGVMVPEWRRHEIALIDLATHTSGLPFFPTDLPLLEDWLADPTIAADYSPDRLYSFLGHCRLLHDVGVHWEYSNLGFGLLGLALASRGNDTYEAMLRSRIIAPLGLTRTSITPTTDMRARLAIGYDAEQKPAPSVDLPALAAAESLHSTANDLLSFLAVCLEYKESPLTPALRMMLNTVRPADDWLAYLGGRQALGWWIIGSGDEQIIAHSGDTAGFSCSLAYCPHTRCGMVALVNGAKGGDDLFLSVLRPGVPLPQTASVPAYKAPRETAVDPAIFDRYAGLYQCAPNVIIVVRREGERLTFMAPGSPRVWLHPQNESEFFINGADVAVAFQPGEHGRASGMIIRINGQLNVPAKRLEPAELR
jgi:CubicO group peptidase (beta-lactamase class C family)